MQWLEFKCELEDGTEVEGEVTYCFREYEVQICSNVSLTPTQKREVEDFASSAWDQEQQDSYEAEMESRYESQGDR